MSQDRQTPRPYHHGDLKAALIAAGLDLTRTGGPEALSIREVTRRVGVSANAAYRHFADRQALLDAVADAIFARIGREMTEAPGAGSGAEVAIERLRTVGRAYVGFARREPGWFAVVFFGPGGGDAIGTSPAAPFLALSSALDGMVTAGVLTPERRAGAEWLCWSAVHGFAELVLHGPLRGAPAHEIDLLAERTIAAIISGVIVPVSAEHNGNGSLDPVELSPTRSAVRLTATTNTRRRQT
jgi:AcrR family transcriptional regulator